MFQTPAYAIRSFSPRPDSKHSFQLFPKRNHRRAAAVGATAKCGGDKTAHGNYHFWVLPDNADLQRSNPREWNPTRVASAAPVISALGGRAPVAVAAAVPQPSAPPAFGSAPAATPGAPAYPAPAYPASAYPAQPVAQPAQPAPVFTPQPAVTAAQPMQPMPNTWPRFIGRICSATPPPGWMPIQYSDGITITTPTIIGRERCLHQPFRPGSGNLINDVNVAFQQVYNTYQIRNQTSDGLDMPPVLDHGVSGQGLGIRHPQKSHRPTAQGRPDISNAAGLCHGRQPERKFSGCVRAEVALVSACFSEAINDVWLQFFYSLRFRDWPVTDQSQAMPRKFPAPGTSRQQLLPISSNSPNTAVT